MIVELQLNLRKPWLRCRMASRARKQEKDGIELAPSYPQHLQSPDANLPQVKRRQSTGLNGNDAPRKEG